MTVEVLPDITNDTLMWTFLVGVLLPNGIALVNQTRWSATAKGIVALIISGLAGAGTAYFNDAFTGRGIVSSILVVGVMAWTTYQTFWKPSGIAPAIERATSGSGTRY